MNDPRFPIGRFERKDVLNPQEREVLIDQIAEAPARLREAAARLSESQLGTPYREGGWTARQVLHHVPDSHLNAYTRFKLALTETVPTIRPYDEAAWAELADSRDTPIETSLTLLESLHIRWVSLLRSMVPADFARTLIHPDHGAMTLDNLLALYAWHGRHHAGHVASVRR